MFFINSDTLFLDSLCPITTIDDVTITDDFVIDNVNNYNYNSIISSYYDRLYKEYSNVFSNSIIPKSKLYELDNCNKFWLTDVYVNSKVIDYKGTYNCKDKFCNNCKKLKQAIRLSRYSTLLSSYSSNLYHIVFTIPNVDSLSLKDSIRKMSIAFSKLMRIFRGNYRCYLDLSCYKLLGALRSLEVTFNEDSYHPHYHCFFAFDNLTLVKNNVNCYSYSNRSSDIRYFSNFEILLQKLWYMLYNDIPITKDNYNSINIGYSVICDKAREEDYLEVFKYITKSTDESDRVLSYENFKTLYFGLFRIKQIQGYGCFYIITDDDITKDEVDSVYFSILSILNSDDESQECVFRPIDLLKFRDYTIISRKEIFKYLKKCN